MERLRRPMKACLSITRRFLSGAIPPEKSSGQLDLDHLFEGITRPRPASISPSPKGLSQPSNRRPNITWGELTDTLHKADHSKPVTPEQIWNLSSQSRIASIQKLQKEREHAGMYWGRSFPSINGNPISSYARVMTTLRENKIRKELRLAERFEKPTDKRRRLKSERHRRRFAEMVSKSPHVLRPSQQAPGHSDKSEGQSRACHTRTWRVMESVSCISPSGLHPSIFTSGLAEAS